MKRTIIALFSFVLAVAASTVVCAQSLSPNTKWHWEGGTIVVDTPARPAGQKSVLGLTAPKMETVRVGFAGLGSRGPWAVKRYCHIPGVQIVALCDYEEERARDAQKFLREAGLPPADIYSGETGYVDMCKRKDIDLIYVAPSPNALWKTASIQPSRCPAP